MLAQSTSDLDGSLPLEPDQYSLMAYGTERAAAANRAAAMKRLELGDERVTARRAADDDYAVVRLLGERRHLASELRRLGAARDLQPVVGVRACKRDRIERHIVCYRGSGQKLTQPHDRFCNRALVPHNLAVQPRQ